MVLLPRECQASTEPVRTAVAQRQGLYTQQPKFGETVLLWI